MFCASLQKGPEMLLPTLSFDEQPKILTFIRQQYRGVTMAGEVVTPPSGAEFIPTHNLKLPDGNRGRYLRKGTKYRVGELEAGNHLSIYSPRRHLRIFVGNSQTSVIDWRATRNVRPPKIADTTKEPPVLEAGAKPGFRAHTSPAKRRFSYPHDLC